MRTISGAGIASAGPRHPGQITANPSAAHHPTQSGQRTKCMTASPAPGRPHRARPRANASANARTGAPAFAAVTACAKPATAAAHTTTRNHPSAGPPAASDPGYIAARFYPRMAKPATPLRAQPRRRTAPRPARPDELDLYPPDFWVEPARVEPVHAVGNTKHFRSVLASMKRDGWQGRPLLVESVGAAGWLAWTGSHRTAAAQALGIPIPVVVLDKRAYVRVHGRPVRSYLSETVDDVDRLGRLLECGDDRAARLMARECGLTAAAAERALRRPRRRTGGPPRAGSPLRPAPAG